MKFLIVFSLAFATVWTKDMYSRSIEAPMVENEGRIANGKNANPGQFNYMVGISYIKSITGHSYFCGGSLIGDSWVLTVAHCMANSMVATVYLGDIYLHFGEKVYKVYKVDNDMIMHPHFDNELQLNDIGLIRIPKTSKSGTIGFVKLPKTTVKPYVGATVIMAGWGHTSDGSQKYSDVLKYVEMEVSTGMYCLRVFPHTYFPSAHLCCDTVLRESPCLGDNGGPLVLPGENIQIGVFAYSAESGCTKGIPTVFTRVSFYVDWIRSETKISD